MTATSRHFRAATIPTSTAGAGDWREEAACRAESPEAFFPDAGYLGKRLTREGFSLAVEEARAVCRRCPVTTECLTWALEHDERWGIWGGLTEDERAAMHRRERRNRVAECGTPSGYRRHRTLDEEACESCRAAHATKARQDYARRQGRTA